MVHSMQKLGIILIIIVILLISYQGFMMKKDAITCYLEKFSAKKKIFHCLKSSRNLTGLHPINKEIQAWDEMEKKYNVLPGGHYKPNCKTNESVAIIVPYRDRAFHLKVFINNIHSILQRQLLEYGIYIIEQSDTNGFNRGMLMNIGFVESLKYYNYNCYIFHDIDLIPENDKNIYDCEDSPKHMSVAVDIFNYKLPYKALFGGVVALNRTEFQKINGFSNRFFDWGGEDDDLYKRIGHHNFVIHRQSVMTARYTMLKHSKQKENGNRFRLLKTTDYENDGLNKLNYTIKESKQHKLFTLVKVHLIK